MLCYASINISINLFSTCRLIEAINDCEAASKIDPHSPKLHGRRGRALMRLGRIQEANEAFLAVLSISRAEASEGEDVEKESSAKEQARAAMKKLALARVLRNRIESQVVLKEFKNVIKSADEMLSICPLAIDARTHKARALCQVHRFEESKEFTEALISGLHSTTRQFFQHSAAPAVTPSRESLSWCERSDTQVVVDTASVTQFMLCCGSELSQIYLCSLKNNKLAGSGWCADAIDKITLILKGLDYSINSTRSSSLAWSWVADELDRLSRLASGKIYADEKFRKKCFLNAKDAYTALLEVCVLYSSYDVALVLT
jgi:tetratricopeptide (TPR) repeat protein